MVLMLNLVAKKEAKRQGKENENEITKQLRYFQLTCVRIRLFTITSKSNFEFHFFFCIRFLVCLTFLSHDESSEKSNNELYKKNCTHQGSIVLLTFSFFAFCDFKVVSGISRKFQTYPNHITKRGFIGNYYFDCFRILSSTQHKLHLLIAIDIVNYQAQIRRVKSS